MEETTTGMFDASSLPAGTRSGLLASRVTSVTLVVTILLRGVFAPFEPLQSRWKASPSAFPTDHPEVIVLGNRCGFTLSDPALDVQAALSRAAPRWLTPTRLARGVIRGQYLSSMRFVHMVDSGPILVI